MGENKKPKQKKMAYISQEQSKRFQKAVDVRGTYCKTRDASLAQKVNELNAYMNAQRLSLLKDLGRLQSVSRKTNHEHGKKLKDSHETLLRFLNTEQEKLHSYLTLGKERVCNVKTLVEWKAFFEQGRQLLKTTTETFLSGYCASLDANCSGGPSSICESKRKSFFGKKTCILRKL